MIRIVKSILFIAYLIIFNKAHADNTERDPNGVIINYGNGITTYTSDVTAFEKFHEFGMNIANVYSDSTSFLRYNPKKIAAAQDPSNIESGWSAWDPIDIPRNIYDTVRDGCVVTGPGINTDRPGSYTGKFVIYADARDPLNDSRGQSMDLNKEMFTAYLTADGLGVLASHTFIANEANNKTDGLYNGKLSFVRFNDPSQGDWLTPTRLPIALTYDSSVPLRNVQLKICRVVIFGHITVHQTLLDFKYAY